MEYEDRIAIPAPEGIEFEYTLAGAGSRFVAELLDVLLRLVALGVLVGVLAALGGGPIAQVVAILAVFLAWFAYDIVFEVWGSGRTPGKRLNRLRVVMSGGQPIGLGSSTVRTLLRLIDQWASIGIVAMTTITLTRRNQRLGDLAAGTIVVRERRARTPAPSPSEPVTALAGVDVTAITADELAAVRDFLTRRDSLPAEHRLRVARALADPLSARVGGLLPGELSAERLLETIAATKAGARYGSPP